MITIITIIHLQKQLAMAEIQLVALYICKTKVLQSVPELKFEFKNKHNGPREVENHLAKTNEFQYVYGCMWYL